MCPQRRLETQRGCNSVVECQLPKLNVAGSNPVTRFGPEARKFPKDTPSGTTICTFDDHGPSSPFSFSQRPMRVG